MATFTHMTDAQLAAHIVRLERLADTSADTDEYCALLHKLTLARDEQGLRSAFDDGGSPDFHLFGAA